MILGSERLKPRCESDRSKCKQNAADSENICDAGTVSDNLCQPAHRPLLRKKFSDGLHKFRFNIDRPIHPAHHTCCDDEQVTERKLLFWRSDIGRNHQSNADNGQQKKRHQHHNRSRIPPVDAKQPMGGKKQYAKLNPANNKEGKHIPSTDFSSADRGCKQSGPDAVFSCF